MGGEEHYELRTDFEETAGIGETEMAAMMVDGRDAAMAKTGGALDWEMEGSWFLQFVVSRRHCPHNQILRPAE